MPSVLPVATDTTADVAPPSLKEVMAAAAVAPNAAIPTFPKFEYESIFDTLGQYGDFRDEISEKGYAVIPALSVEKALSLRDRAHQWLEDFQIGYKRDDRSTFTVDKLPVHVKGVRFFPYPPSLLPCCDVLTTLLCTGHVPRLRNRS